jgi:hypothetical protein
MFPARRLPPRPPNSATLVLPFPRKELRDAIAGRVDGLGFLPRNNPILRHTVLRKRATLEDMGLLDRIALDIWPSEHEHLPMFEGLALHTSAEFEVAYAAAKDFSVAMRRRATDAACEGLNLQTLGALINVDLPWNPSRLEQRIGRIKRIPAEV